MTRLVAILVILFLVIPAEADVTLRPVPGWTVIQVYDVIKAGDFATFQRYMENVDPAATLVIVTGPGGDLSAGIGIGAALGHISCPSKCPVGTRTPEETDRRSNRHVRVVMCPDMDRWRNRA
jgi:hypothetical protein